jgi:uncharacterized protein (TIRG00374 family)
LPHAADGSQWRPGWHYRAVVWSILLAAVGYLGFALWSGWREVMTAVGKVGALGVATALSLSLCNYGLRFCRWQAYLRALDHPVPWWPSLRIYVAGFALTTTPGKAGEALRGVLLKRLGIPYPVSLAAFVSERLSDLLAIILLTLVGLAAFPRLQPLIAVGTAGVLAAFLVLSSRGLLERLHRTSGRSRSASLIRQVSQVLLQARRCHAPRLLATATGLGLLAWAAEAWAFHLILRWMGLDVPLAFSVFVYAISMLAGALSFMPGGLGGAEIVMASLLVWKGMGSADAIAATVLIRLSTLWFAVAIGVVALLALRGRTRKAATNHGAGQEEWR